MLSRGDLKHAIKAFTDNDPSDELLDTAINRFCKSNNNSNSSSNNNNCSSDRSYKSSSSSSNISSSNSSTMITYNEFKKLLLSGLLQPSHKGRYWVGISLSEAETIRRIIHIRNSNNSNSNSDNRYYNNIIPNFNTEICLRYNPISDHHHQQHQQNNNNNNSNSSNSIFDCSRNYNTMKPTSYESSIVHNSFRFFDCDMHFSFPAINILIKNLHSSISDRERFFLSTIGCRRRMERKWQETPLAKVFTIANEWISLKQKAQVVYILEALKDMNITLWEAFTIFDYDNNGLISPSELYGALLWLKMPNITAEDVLDFFELADINRDGMIDYKEYMDLFTIMDNQQQQHQQQYQLNTIDKIENNDNNVDAIDDDNDNNNDKNNNFIKVEPYGIEILRELIIQRKLKEQNRIRDERIRKQIYTEELDIKIFNEELYASKLRKGGANPLVTMNCNTIMPILVSSNTTISSTTTSSSSNSISSGNGNNDINVIQSSSTSSTQIEITSLSTEITNTTTTTTVTHSDNMKGISIVDFRFTTNQHPLRFNASGKSSFVPIHLGTAANHPLKPMKCDKNHELLSYDYYWQECNRCKIR